MAQSCSIFFLSDLHLSFSLLITPQQVNYLRDHLTNERIEESAWCAVPWNEEDSRSEQLEKNILIAAGLCAE